MYVALRIHRCVLFVVHIRRDAFSQQHIVLGGSNYEDIPVSFRRESLTAVVAR